MLELTIALAAWLLLAVPAVAILAGNEPVDEGDDASTLPGEPEQ